MRKRLLIIQKSVPIYLNITKFVHHSMKARLLATLIVLLLASAGISIPLKADVAPIQFLNGANSAVFVENSAIILWSYNVNVEVNKHNVTEILSYCLFNPTDKIINETLMVPILFNSGDTNLDIGLEDIPSDWAGNWSKCVMSAELTIDGVTKKVLQGNITEAVHQYIYMEGVYSTVNLNPYSFTNISIKCLKVPGTGDYLETFNYFYTAETACFWNGTVHHGVFHLTFNGNYSHINFTAPNAIVNGSEAFSEVWDIDVRNIDANYSVEISTGYTNPPENPEPEIHDNTRLIMLICVLLAIPVAAMFIFFYRKRLRT